MTLWSRSIALSVAVVVALAVIVFAVDRRARRDEAATFVMAALHERLDADELARCERSPGTWSPRRRLTVLPLAGRGDVPFVEDEAAPGPDGPPSPFRIAAVDARGRGPLPPLDAETVQRLARPGDGVVRGSRWSDVVEVVVASSRPDGPCAFVAAMGPVDAIVGSALPRARAWLLPGLAAAGVALVALASVLRRLRRMREGVTASARGARCERSGDEVADLEHAVVAFGRDARAQLAATAEREGALRDSLADTAHDVIVPLTALQAHLATMQEQERVDHPAGRIALTSAMAEAQYLSSMLHNLAAAARLDERTSSPSFEDVELNALVRRVVSRHRTIARRLEVAVEFSVPDEALRVVGDVTLLEQAVGNVVYNAVRYNRPGGHVAVVLEPMGDGRFTLHVADDGPGVGEDELARIVERGFRGRATSEPPTGGRGLGLDIACRVARLHRLQLRFGRSASGGLRVELEGARVQTGQG